MTALKPLPNLRVVGLKDGQMKLLRKLVRNKTCAHPECADPTHDVHHLWPRSLITNDSYFVEITEDDGSKTVIPNFTGLCRRHHQGVELHASWIRLEDGVFNWYDRMTGVHYQRADWALTGPLTPQPGEVGEVKKTRKRKQGAERRARRVYSIAVPKDDQEDGAGVLDDYVELGRELWSEDLNWSDNAPAYNVICAAFGLAFHQEKKR